MKRIKILILLFLVFGISKSFASIPKKVTVSPTGQLQWLNTSDGTLTSTGTLILDGHIEVQEGQEKTFVDMPVSTTTAGLIRSYDNEMDGNKVFAIEGLTDGGGGIVDTKLRIYDNSYLQLGSTTTAMGFRNNNNSIQMKDINTGNWRSIIGARTVYVNSLQDIIDNATFDGYNITFQSGANYEIHNTIYSPYPFNYPIGGFVSIRHAVPGDTVLVNISTSTMHNAIAPGLITMFDGVQSSPFAPFFNINGTSDGIIAISRFVINGTTDLGNINTVQTFNDFFLAQDIGEGIKFNNNAALVFRNSGAGAWKNLVSSTTMITVDGFLNYYQIHNCAFIPGSNEYIFDFEPTMSTLSSVLADNNIVLEGAGIFAPGSQKQEQLTGKYAGNTKLRDSQVFTNIYFEGNATATPIAGISVSTGIIADIFVEKNTERIVVSTTTGVVTYIGLEDVVLKIQGNCIMEPVSGGTQILNVYTYLNGVEVNGSKGTTSTSPTNPRSASFFVSVSLKTNDKLQFFVENETAANNILVINFHALISD